jgi:hypothetical protein
MSTWQLGACHSLVGVTQPEQARRRRKARSRINAKGPGPYARMSRSRSWRRQPLEAISTCSQGVPFRRPPPLVRTGRSHGPGSVDEICLEAQGEPDGRLGLLETVTALRDLPELLGQIEQADRATLYEALGLTVRYCRIGPTEEVTFTSPLRSVDLEHVGRGTPTRFSGLQRQST